MSVVYIVDGWPTGSVRLPQDRRTRLLVTLVRSNLQKETRETVLPLHSSYLLVVSGVTGDLLFFCTR